MIVVDIVKMLDEAFSRLQEANAKAEIALCQDRYHPVVLPEHPGSSQRELATNEITRLWYRNQEDLRIQSGIVCASPTTVAAIQSLNEAKAQFKTTVVAIRKQIENEKHASHLALRRLIEQNESALSNDEWNELKIAFARLQWQRLDLLHCYANVRILPDHCESVSWTWAAVHSSQVVIKKSDAIKLADALSEPDKIRTLSDLAKVRQENLIQYKRLPPQLRMNVVYKVEGERMRKAFTVSGILIEPSPTLPKYLWREAPESQKANNRRSLKRSDATLQSEPCVPLLNLYVHN